MASAAGSEIDHLLFGECPLRTTSPKYKNGKGAFFYSLTPLYSLSSSSAHHPYIISPLPISPPPPPPHATDLDGTLYAIENGYEKACRDRVFEFMVGLCTS
jgi:hypothetical protein